MQINQRFNLWRINYFDIGCVYKDERMQNFQDYHHLYYFQNLFKK